jgi:hypothetical protein
MGTSREAQRPINVGDWDSWARKSPDRLVVRVSWPITRKQWSCLIEFLVTVEMLEQNLGDMLRSSVCSSGVPCSHVECITPKLCIHIPHTGTLPAFQNLSHHLRIADAKVICYVFQVADHLPPDVFGDV